MFSKFLLFWSGLVTIWTSLDILPVSASSGREKSNRKGHQNSSLGGKPYDLSDPVKAGMHNG